MRYYLSVQGSLSPGAMAGLSAGVINQGQEAHVMLCSFVRLPLVLATAAGPAAG